MPEEQSIQQAYDRFVSPIWNSSIMKLISSASEGRPRFDITPGLASCAGMITLLQQPNQIRGKEAHAHTRRTWFGVSHQIRGCHLSTVTYRTGFEAVRVDVQPWLAATAEARKGKKKKTQLIIAGVVDLMQAKRKDERKRSGSRLPCRTKI